MITGLQSIVAYRTATGWAFDDVRRGLQAEPFVYGADTLISEILASQGQEHVTRCRLTFSDQPFMTATVCLQREASEELEGLPGTWYREFASKRRAWLCPALTVYFEEPPATLYVQVVGVEGVQSHDDAQ